jgi:hypothetical protein
MRPGNESFAINPAAVEIIESIVTNKKRINLIFINSALVFEVGKSAFQKRPGRNPTPIINQQLESFIILPNLK